MRFFRWVIKKYIDDDSMKGVVARTFKADKNKLPHNRRASTIRRYIVQNCDASQGFMDAFDELVEEYERENH